MLGMIDVQDEAAVTESPRPNLSQPITHYDPLDLDSEDLFVKYKVFSVWCTFSYIFRLKLCHFSQLAWIGSFYGCKKINWKPTFDLWGFHRL